MASRIRTNRRKLHCARAQQRSTGHRPIRVLPQGDQPTRREHRPFSSRELCRDTHRLPHSRESRMDRRHRRLRAHRSAQPQHRPHPHPMAGRCSGRPTRRRPDPLRGPGLIQLQRLLHAPHPRRCRLGRCLRRCALDSVSPLRRPPSPRGELLHHVSLGRLARTPQPAQPLVGDSRPPHPHRQRTTP